MTRLPFTTDEVREQCARFGDAPLAHPLPVKHILLMCRYIDDLEAELKREVTWSKLQQDRAWRAEAIIANALVLCRSRPGSDAAHYLEPVRRALEPPT